ncbi:VOC family protein [Microbacterium gorillae]|uniref:VOC family protein n=1 Tax=Microbacterium gorillae TaxID=1231063 RepID=UPI003D993865
MPRIGRAVVPVSDLDVAINWYRELLDFEVVFDSEIFPGFRSVHVSPGRTAEAGVWLFPADGAGSASHPAVVLYSDDLDGDVSRLLRGRADIESPLSGEEGSRSIQLRDPFGNVLIIADTPR